MTEDLTQKGLTPLEDLNKIKVSMPKTYAGGIPAILSSLKIVKKEMGLLRGSKSLLSLNQKKGFDCPGCAWPDPDDERSPTEFCENGAKAAAEEGTRKKVDAKFFSDHSLEELRQKSDFWLGSQGRLSEPMLLVSGDKNYRPTSWDRAFELLSKELSASKADETVFYTSGRTSNEAAFLYQLFARKLGTNNLPDCSNMCHESSGVAMNESIGIGKGTVSLDDFQSADCIFVIGQNPGTNHPRMLSTLQKAVRSGSKIISINPLNEAGTNSFVHPQEPWNFVRSPGQLSSLHLPILLGGDGAFFQALNQELVNKDRQQNGAVLDHKFIKGFTSGYPEYVEHLLKKDKDKLLRQAGISRELFEETVGMVCASKNIICCWAMGLTQHEEGVGIIQEVLNFLMLRGNLGRKGSGACPVRGHSNVQGDRTMGIWEKPPEAFLKSLDLNFAIKSPRVHGYDVVETIQAMSENKVRVFMAMGGNFLSATPDTKKTVKSLQNCNLTVQVSTKLNRSHLFAGKNALILPCLSRSDKDRDQFVSAENSMGIVSKSKGSLKPVSRLLKSEVEIICGLAQKLFPDSKFSPWNDMANNYDLIRDKISSTIPGFENYNERLKNKKYFYLPNPVRDQRIFHTKTKKAQFKQSDFKVDDYLDDNEFFMMTLRSHDQYNTTIYGLDDRYRGISGGRRIIYMNPKDMLRLHFAAEQTVTISSNYEGELRELRGFKLVSYDIPVGCVASYFPETNPLIPLSLVAKKSNTPVSKKVRVKILKEK